MLDALSIAGTAYLLAGLVILVVLVQRRAIGFHSPEDVLLKWLGWLPLLISLALVALRARFFEANGGE